VSGFVVSSGAKGVFVRIAPGVTARVPLSRLTDSFSGGGGGAPAYEAFAAGRLVTGRVTSSTAQPGGPRVELSLLATNKGRLAASLLARSAHPQRAATRRPPACTRPG
jgi:hypothetical protein